MTVDLHLLYQAILAPGDIKLLELRLTDERRRQYRGAQPVRMWFWRTDVAVGARRIAVPAAPFELLGVDCDGKRALVGPAWVWPDDRGTPWDIDWPPIDIHPPKLMVRSREHPVGITIDIECVIPALVPRKQSLGASGTRSREL